MCDVISFLNKKGGCGKTTNSTSFAYCLFQKGYKVLLIDFDGQHNASISFNVDDSDSRQFTIVELLQLVGRKAPLPEKKDYIIKTDSVDLITCNYLYDSLDSFFQNLSNGQFIFKKFLAISGLILDYDFIIIDNNPSFSVSNINSLLACNHVIIPVFPDLFNSVGMLQIIKQISDVIDDRDLNLNNIKIAGILIGCDEANTNISKKYKDEYIKNNIPTFNTVIPRNISVKNSQEEYSVVVKTEPKSKSAIAYNEFTDEYLNYLKKEGVINEKSK